MDQAEDQTEEQGPADRGPVVRVRVGGTDLRPEYMDMPLETATHWDVDIWRKP